MFTFRFSIVSVSSLLVWTLAIASVWADVPSGATAGFGKKRTWSDKSGKFKIEAKLTDAQRKSVRLLKDDGREVTIPFANLSEPDQAFVESFLAAAAAAGNADDESPENPFAGGELKSSSKGNGNRKPPDMDSDDEDSGEEKKSSSKGEGKSSDIPGTKMNIKKAKPIKVSLEKDSWKASKVAPFKLEPFPDQVIKLPMKKGFFDGVSMCVAGVKRTSIIGLYQTGGRGPNSEPYARLGCYSLKDREPTLIGVWKDPWKIYAASPDAKRFAAVSVSIWDKGNELAIFELGSDGKYAPLLHFTAGGGDWDEVIWAGFLSSNRVVTISQKGTLTIWDLEAKMATHMGNTGGPTSAVIGGRGELIALPSQRGIALLQGEDGKQVGVIPVESSFVPAVAFSPNGESLAVYTPFNVSIYSLADGERKQSIWIKEEQQGTVSWVGSYVLLNNKLLLDSERGIPVWTYELKPQAQAVFGGQLFALFSGEQGSTLVTTRMPHISIDEKVQKVSSDNLYCVRPGSTFKVNANWSLLSPDEQRACETSINAQLGSLGWVPSGNAENELIINLEQGKNEEADYYESDGRFGPIGPRFGRPTGPSTHVSERTWDHSIVIKHKGVEVHRAGLHVGLPSGIHLKEGETTIQAVQRHMKPSASFFQNTKLPKQILRPEYQGGFGKSQITETGVK